MTDGFEGSELSHGPSLDVIASNVRTASGTLVVLARKTVRQLATGVRVLGGQIKSRL